MACFPQEALQRHPRETHEHPKSRPAATEKNLLRLESMTYQTCLSDGIHGLIHRPQSVPNSVRGLHSHLYVRFSRLRKGQHNSPERQTRDALAWCERGALATDPTRVLTGRASSGYAGKHLANGALGSFVRLVETGRVLAAASSSSAHQRSTAANAIHERVTAFEAECDALQATFDTLRREHWCPRSIHDLHIAEHGLLRKFSVALARCFKGSHQRARHCCALLQLSARLPTT